jgi:hypothetical protein
MAGKMAYQMKGRVVLRRIGEDRLLVPVSGGAAREPCVFPVNETGEFLWARLLEGRTADEAAAALAAEFDVEPEAARADAREFVETLLQQGLIEEAAP